jgi:hypothetical protein
MVKKLALPAVMVSTLLLAAGCGMLTVSPFPAYTDKTEVSLDLGARIRAITGGGASVSYDLEVVVDPAGALPPRVLLLVEPPSSDPTLGFNYTGKLIVMDQDLTVLGEAGTASSLDYFSKPYAYCADGAIIAGYTVLNASGGTVMTLTPQGLAGFAFTDGTSTYVFSTPGGQYASFDLSFMQYNNTWGLLYSSVQTLAIIPQAARPSSSDPAYANLGYQLLGLTYDPGSDMLTFVFSEPYAGTIHAARMSRAAALAPGAVILPDPTGWPVGSDAWPLSVTQDRPALSAAAGGLFMVQRDGWLASYAWTSASQALAWVGSPARIAGDRSLSRRYAFLAPAEGAASMYRFDPSSGILTRYGRWW